MAPQNAYSRALLVLALAVAPLTGPQGARADQTPGNGPIVIGLSADMSASTAQTGEAILRGIQIAMKEVNESGGVLGRRLSLEVRDHRNNPARAIDTIDEFARTENLVAVMGGPHTPTAIAELEPIHRHGIVYLGPWAAGTKLVQNGHDPNFVFRVSAPDRLVGPFLIGKAIERGFKRPGLLLWNTAWGRSNETAMVQALHERGLEPAGIEWFNTSEADMSAQLDRLAEQGADVIMLVANPDDGVVAVRSMANRPAAVRAPIISHWGITIGTFYQQTADILAGIDLSFLQTYSFLRPPAAEKARKLYSAYCAEYPDCQAPEHLPVPGAIAHAYDLVHLLSRAIEKSGGTDRAKIRDAMENLEAFEGAMGRYDPPFTAEAHDALKPELFILCRYSKDGAILPMNPAGG